jgi:uncharacterized protein DUF3551
MRRISLAILATASILTAIGSITPAAAAQDTYCLQGRRWGYPGQCAFSTYQQCMVTASGTADYCGINPMRAFGEQPRRRQQYRY